MDVRDDLLAMERTLWLGGRAEYRGALDDDCLLAFTTMAGVSSRAEVADQVRGNRWRDLEIDVEGFLRPTDDVALVTYRASAVRGDEPYEARVSSGYVRRDGAWKLMFHQQTPLGAGQKRRSETAQ